MKHLIFTFFTILFCKTIIAQEKNNVVKVQVIDVVKSYVPQISNADKIRDVPKIPAEKLKNKSNHKNDVVLANKVFSPSLGNFKAYKIKKKNEFQKSKNNYFYFGYGNANTRSLDAFLQKNYKNHHFKMTFNHFFSDANVKNTPVKNAYQNNHLKLDHFFYKKNKKWISNISYENKERNWYGVGAKFSGTKDLDFQQKYHNAHFSETLQIKDAFLKKIAMNYDFFWDKFNSNEQYLGIESSLEFPYDHSFIFTNLLLEYLNTKFASPNRKFSYLTLGTDLSYPLKEGDFYLSIGVNFRYNKNLSQDEKAGYHLYPNVKISYKLLEEIINPYAGFHGNLYRRSYQNFVHKNPFVAPELDIKMTNRNFEFYIGAKGKITNRTTYNLKGAYALEKNTPFFVHKAAFEKAKPYALGNSFIILYDNTTQIRFLGQLQSEIIKNLNMHADIQYVYYQPETEKAAWNIPALSGSLGMSYKKQNISMGFTGFFVGNRYEFQNNKITNLPFFVDMGFSGTYRFSSGLHCSLSMDNLLNSAYQPYVEYYVQGFQVVLGAKFCFEVP